MYNNTCGCKAQKVLNDGTNVLSEYPPGYYNASLYTPTRKSVTVLFGKAQTSNSNSPGVKLTGRNMVGGLHYFQT
jgi:hypothetical protein